VCVNIYNTRSGNDNQNRKEDKKRGKIMEIINNHMIPPDMEYKIHNEINHDEPIQIGSEFEADVLLIQIGDIESEMSHIDELHRQEIEHINSWQDKEMENLSKKQGWLKYNLELYLVQSEKKRLSLPHGSVYYRKQPYHVEIRDDLKLIKSGFVRTTESVDKKSILSHFKSSGEIPEGCEIERPEEKLYVKPSVINKGA
jgi:phage host-nuclease inhibitor protein Gam